MMKDEGILAKVVSMLLKGIKKWPWFRARLFGTLKVNKHKPKQVRRLSTNFSQLSLLFDLIPFLSLLVYFPINY